MQRRRRERGKWVGRWMKARMRRRRKRAFESPRGEPERDQRIHSQAMTVVPVPQTQLEPRCPPSVVAVAASTPSSKRSPSHTPSPAPEYFLLLPQATCRCHHPPPPHPSSCPSLIALLLVAHPLFLSSFQKAARPTLFELLAPPPTQSPHHPSSTDALPAAGKSAKLP